MGTLKLSLIVDDKPVKVTLDLPAKLHRDLSTYSRAIAQQSGEPEVDPVRLIVPMLERFIATDREFAKFRRKADG